MIESKSMNFFRQLSDFIINIVYHSNRGSLIVQVSFYKGTVLCKIIMTTKFVTQYSDLPQWLFLTSFLYTDIRCYTYKVTSFREYFGIEYKWPHEINLGERNIKRKTFHFIHYHMWCDRFMVNCNDRGNEVSDIRKCGVEFYVPLIHSYFVIYVIPCIYGWLETMNLVKVFFAFKGISSHSHHLIIKPWTSLSFSFRTSVFANVITGSNMTSHVYL